MRGQQNYNNIKKAYTVLSQYHIEKLVPSDFCLTEHTYTLFPQK